MYEHRLVRPLQRSLVCSFVILSPILLQSMQTQILRSKFMCVSVCLFVRDFSYYGVVMIMTDELVSFGYKYTVKT